MGGSPARCLIATFYNVRKLTATVHTFQDAIHPRGWINGELQQNWQQVPSSSPLDRELLKQNRLWPQTSVKTREPENNKLLLAVLQRWCKDDFICTGLCLTWTLMPFKSLESYFLVLAMSEHLWKLLWLLLENIVSQPAEQCFTH